MTTPKNPITVDDLTTVVLNTRRSISFCVGADTMPVAYLHAEFGPGNFSAVFRLTIDEKDIGRYTTIEHAKKALVNRLNNRAAFDEANEMGENVVELRRNTVGISFDQYTLKTATGLEVGFTAHNEYEAIAGLVKVLNREVLNK